ncbi:hypothetical protein [Blastococcus xanthinilyticus]|uniref:TspO/MBR related protein n=1 Tax=Blastococcus xanthinilyticus TaxID=1564164 RepID=A0A5S5CNT3_9ACTN|nr:hypothetical protein [Blastococcus xanthinilyticus]TYP82081.1 hypothetical protein BD833_12065 [Blastococcus xanthinilyticus]
MPTTARKQHRIGTGGPWGTGLLLLGVAAIAQGIGYLVPRTAGLPGALDALGTYVPIQVGGIFWIAAGAYAVAQALTPPQSHHDVWPLVVMTSLWSLAYLVHWSILAVADGNLTRQWTSGVAWGSLAALIICWGRCVNPPTKQRR